MSGYETALNQMRSLKKKGDMKGAIELIKNLSKKSMCCNSKIFVLFIQIQRHVKKHVKPNDLFRFLSNLGVHRPSFGLLAMIVTSYATRALEKFKRSVFVDYTISSIQIMFKKYKYVPNIYLLNHVLNMISKVGTSLEFWNFFIDVQKRFGVDISRFDSYTFGCLFFQCVKEKNPFKMEMFVKISERMKVKEDHFIKNMKRRMRKIRKRQKDIYFNVPVIA